MLFGQIQVHTACNNPVLIITTGFLGISGGTADNWLTQVHPQNKVFDCTCELSTSYCFLVSPYLKHNYLQMNNL